MKAEIKQLQQARCPNNYSNITGTSGSFKSMNGQITCCRCNCVGHFAYSCKTNLTSMITNTCFPHAQPHAGDFQSQGPGYVNYGTSQCLQPQYLPNDKPWHTTFRTENHKKHNTMGYHYLQDYIYNRAPWKPTSQFVNNKHQSRRSNIPGQHKN